MKKLLTLFLALMCATSIFAAEYDCKIDGIYYKLDEANMTATVTYKEWEKPTYSGSIVIPNTISYHRKKYSVTTIGEYAFYKCSGLTSVTIPNSVTTIGKLAFYGCSGLTSVTIPNSVTTIGDVAFVGCSNLTSVTIPNSVTTIGSEAFGICSSLTSVTIPNSVTKIGNYAFSGCSNLTSINVGAANTHYCSIDGVLFNYTKDTLIQYPIGNTRTEYAIPNSVTTIEVGAFGTSNLISVTIPNSVTTIGDEAFSYCKSLTSVTIGNSVTTIGNYAFEGCKSLTSITIPNSVTTIGNEAFGFCYDLNNVFIASKSIHISYSSFKDCSNISIFCAASVKLPSFEGNPQIYILSDDELFLLTPFSVYAQEYVEPRINEWQKKGDFEKVADWQRRVNETTRRQKASELLKEAQKKYLAIYTKENKTFTLGTYDSENEVFLIKGSNTGDLLVSVPINDAQYVQQNWSSHTATPHYAFAGTDIVAESVDFTFPNNKTYTYRSTQDLTYAQTDIQYNFDPIEFNLGSNTSVSKPKGQQTIQQTQLVIGKSDVDTDIPTTGKSSPNTFAVIISNENYTKLKEVPCAINDGKVFAQYCEKTIGLPKDNIKLYTNATYGMMIEAVRNMRNIANAYNGDINIIFYYSGHGAPIDDTKEAYLLPVDAFGVSPEVCYSLNRLYKELADMKAKSVTMFLDACFSGATKDGDMLASVRGVAIKAKANAPQGNMVVFSAASDEQTALPYLDMGHGMFTYYLLKKLKETKGDVTYQALGDYVKQEVYRRSSVKGKAQTPTISASATAEGWQDWKLR
ncbi:MAG: leucine-rich repeat protein [Bacteroidales bacterium]|nr:leucine-rich repeat protein [Bacteroidales bacterium]